MKQTWFALLNNLQNPADAVGIFLILAVMIMLILGIWQLRKHALVIRTGEVAVMFNRKRGTFCGFLPAGRHLVWPGSDRQLKGTISTCKKTLQGINKVYSRDGFPLTLTWTLVYRLNPGSIERVMQPSMAGILLSNPTRIAELQTIHCLEKIVGQHNLEVLRRDGVRQKVNACTTRSVVDCLAAYGIMVSEIKIGPVQWPTDYNLPSQSSVSARLSEDDLSQMAKTRSDRMGSSRTNLNPAQTAELSSAPPIDEPNARGLSDQHAMSWNYDQHMELQSDPSTGKLVV